MQYDNTLPQTTGGFLTNDDYFAEIAEEAKSLKGGGDGKAYMKFNGNDGNYAYGADDIELPEGTQLAMNPLSYARGWVIWNGGDVVHEVMAKKIDGPGPTKVSLPDHGPYAKGDGPSEQYTMDFKTLEDPLVEMVFQANNVSKRRAMGALLKDFGSTYKMHPQCLPVVEIGSTTFDAKDENGRKFKKYAPVFKIVDWIHEDELLALSGDNPADYEATPSQNEEPKQTEAQQPEQQNGAAPVQRRARQTAPAQTTKPGESSSGGATNGATPPTNVRKGRFS